MAIDLVPKSKTDLEAANRAIAAGYPAVEPVLGELVEWLQDYNWPVAKRLAPFLAKIGSPLVPHLDRIFAGNDDCWKYWIIVCLISSNDDLFEHYKPVLVKYAEEPDSNERSHELDWAANEALLPHGYQRKLS